jgi:FlaA1/EpsC-like NDP-sugar epimerase
MIGDLPIETVVTGIRPGEKIHEILVSEEEAFRTAERDGYYVLTPQLPELSASDFTQARQTEYSSADSVVIGEELEQLVALADFVDPAMSGPGAPASAS